MSRDRYRAKQKSHVCGECGRQTQPNKDGTLRKHRPVADVFAGPYCVGGRA